MLQTATTGISGVSHHLRFTFIASLSCRGRRGPPGGPSVTREPGASPSPCTACTGRTAREWSRSSFSSRRICGTARGARTRPGPSTRRRRRSRRTRGPSSPCPVVSLGVAAAFHQPVAEDGPPEPVHGRGQRPPAHPAALALPALADLPSLAEDPLGAGDALAPAPQARPDRAREDEQAVADGHGEA